MQDLDDLALLREYAANHSETAFEELVSRRVGFVYSSALRQARDPNLAEEITQVVFIILAQKAGRISDKTILTVWLFKTTRFAALAQMRAEMKRSLRTATIEKEFQMQSEIQSAATDEIWNQMSPLLDEALAALGEKDRQAVLLRFFENKSLAEVGNYLGAGEDTARKRVNRALEKLRKFFMKRGVSSTTAIIAGAISANSVQAAPVTLVKSVTAVAIAKGAAASGSTLTLIKGALKIMAWTKAKIVVVAGVVILLATGTTVVLVKHNGSLPKPQSPWPNAVPTAEQIQQVNIGLPELQMQAKGLIFGAMSQKKIPDATSWCDTLNVGGKFWPVTPTNTIFAINSQVAGLVFSRNMHGDTVAFFEASKPGWNQSGGPELLTKNAEGVAVVFLDGRALIVPPDGVAQLRWAP